jgi:hypothetical protein
VKFAADWEVKLVSESLTRSLARPLTKSLALLSSRHRWRWWWRHAALAAESAQRELLEKQREENAEEEANKKSWAKWKRNMYVGGAAVAGGALLAVTGCSTEPVDCYTHLCMPLHALAFLRKNWRLDLDKVLRRKISSFC